VVRYLVTENRGARVFLDLTLGDGGHSAALLNAAHEDATVIGLDRDSEAIQRTATRLQKFQQRFRAVQSNFSDCAQYVEPESVDGVVADLGVSTLHLEEGERGFSFQQDGPLDMRMNQHASHTAADFVNTADEKELADSIYHYGDERASRRIARAICARRTEEAFSRTRDLATVVRRAVGGRRARHGGSGRTIDPATKTFQAIRISVNNELSSLETMLETAPTLLRPKGRLAIISYHSLEDRLVKHQFRAWASESRPFHVLTRRPEKPSTEELAQNPRARSALLRVIERSEV
jgi:16S rRNA (cytosine1402-N4)-methyltransferase